MPSSGAATGRPGPGDARWCRSRGRGLEVAGHRLLGAQVSLAGGGVVLTGRLSVSTQPWLADHAVSGVVVLPGTAFVDLVAHAGLQVGSARVEELTLQAPLVLAEDGPGVTVQVVVDAPGEHGQRTSASIPARTPGTVSGPSTAPAPSPSRATADAA